MDGILLERLKEQLIRHEGEVHHAYQDSEGYWTIGVGRLIDRRRGGGITHQEAMYLLNNDIDAVLIQCRQFPFWFELDDIRRLVIADMVFNMGIQTFKQFKKTIAYLNAGDYSNAASEMLDSRWAKQVGSRADRLSEMMRNGGNYETHT